MGISQAAFGLFVDMPASWSSSWLYGLPLIVLTVVFHVLGLGLISRGAVSASGSTILSRHPMFEFVAVMGATTLLVACLHGIEAGIWAVAYRLLGALPEFKDATLYSLNAMTSYGHENLDLAKHFRLMGAIEALNGWLLFGLSTAFLFSVIERVRPSGSA